MQPIREIVIREYMPGSYEAQEGIRVTNLSSREEFRRFLCQVFGDIPDPRVEELEMEVDILNEELKDSERENATVCPNCS